MNMTMSKPKLLAAAGIVVALGLGISNAAADTAPREDTVTSPGFTIDGSGVIANGSGCPQGTVQSLVSPDQTALTIAFSQYTAAAGPSFNGADRRKACTTTVPIRIPAGYTWGITTVTYRGYADLQEGTKAYQGAKYYFQGGGSGDLNSEVTPDGGGNWEITDKAATMAWAPCNTQSNLVVTSSLRVAPNGQQTSDSFITMDTQDISMHSQNTNAMTFGFGFKRCS